MTFLTSRCVAQRGAGLGVTLASRTIELLGGVLTIKSQVGHGTICRIEVPLKLQNENLGSEEGRSEDEFDAFSPPRAVTHPVGVVGFDESELPALKRAGRCLRRQIRSREVSIIPRLDEARLIICEAEYDLAKNHPEVLSRRLVDGRRVIMLGAAGQEASYGCLRMMRELESAVIHCEYMTRPITPLLVEKVLVHPEERARQITSQVLMDGNQAPIPSTRWPRPRAPVPLVPSPTLPIDLVVNNLESVTLADKGNGDDNATPSDISTPPTLLPRASDTGSTVTVMPAEANVSPRIPLSPVHTNESPLPNGAPPAYNGSIKILIVEDNEMNRKVLVKAVKMTGVPHEIAVDGIEAIEVYKSWQPTVGALREICVQARTCER